VATRRRRRLPGVLLVVALLLLTSPPDLESIVAAMRAREQATTRFHMTYSVEHSFRGVRSDEHSFDGTFSRDGQRVLWRRPGRIHLSGAGGEARIRSKGGGDWGGRVAEKMTPDFLITPEWFGLRFYDGPYSSMVAGESCRVLGRERVGTFDCVKVIFNLGPGSEVVVPQYAWLAVDHGYYPVKAAHFGMPKEPPAESPLGRWIRPDGAHFEIRGFKQVEELVRVGKGWVPVRARHWGESEGVSPYEVVMVAKIGAGDPPFDLPGVDRVLLVKGDGRHALTGAEFRATVLEGWELTWWSGVVGQWQRHPEAFFFYGGLFLLIVFVLVVLGKRLMDSGIQRAT
jgi:hypothetical protein